MTRWVGLTKYSCEVIMRTFAFKLAMWVLVGVLTVIIAFGVGLAFLVCVPVVITYALWEFFIGRHKADAIDIELRKMLEDAR